MTPDRMTTLAQQALASAQQKALTGQHPEVMGLHVLSALLEDKAGTSRSILERAGVSADQIEKITESEISRLPTTSSGAGSGGRAIMEILGKADAISKEMSDSYITGEHLLIALAEVKGPAQEVLDHPAFEIEVATGKVTRLTQGGNVGATIPLRDGSLIYTLNSLQAPTDLYRRAPDGTVTQLTNINGPELNEIDPVDVQRFEFTGADDDQVWGQIIKPAGATGKLPMAFLVHGGPQGSFGNSWSTRWNPKVMAAQGYAVVTVDFHGSTGYGQEFTDSINLDWGGKPLQDLKFGYDAALAADSQIDGERSCALGGSYGGYMMNWIAGNWPDRFDCLVNHAGVFDLRSMALSTEELWFDQWDQGGPWWTRPHPEKWNPVNYITNWKTPTLFIHGEKDFRIPYTQSIMPFTVAQEMDIPSKLLIFPDENHWVLKGKNSVQWYRTVFDWLGKWTKGDQAGAGK